MGINELGLALGISGAMASKLAKRGMPTSSTQAANAWREIHAKPRQWKGKKLTSPARAPRPPLSPRPSPEAQSPTRPEDSPDNLTPIGVTPKQSPTRPEDSPDNLTPIGVTPKQSPTRPEDSPLRSSSTPGGTHAESLDRAIQTEIEAHEQLTAIKRDKLSTIEDVRKASGVYFASRNNRVKAEKDFISFQVEEQSLLYYDEAKSIVSRPHEMAKTTLAGAAKSLSPRCVGQSARAIELVIGNFIDRLTETLRQSV